MQAGTYAGSALYGLLVFGGTALFGLGIAPFLGIVTGLFVIDTESRSFFSLLTLKAAPILVALGVLSGAAYPWISNRGRWTRAALLGANTVAAWLVGAAIALVALG